MDIFVERLVSRKKDFRDVCYTVLVIISGILVSIASFLIPVVKFFAATIIIAVIIVVIHLISLRNIEFEYSFTNGELDIDKIINKKRRKRLYSFNSKDFQIVSSVKNENYIDKVKDIKKKIFVGSSMNSPDIYFIVTDHDKEKVLILFEPDEKMLNAIKSKIPGRVFV